MKDEEIIIRDEDLGEEVDCSPAAVEEFLSKEPVITMEEEKEHLFHFYNPYGANIYRGEDHE